MSRGSLAARFEDHFWEQIAVTFMRYKIVNFFPHNLKLSDIFFEMSNIGNMH